MHRRACHDVRAALLAAYAAVNEDRELRVEATCPVHGVTRSVPWKPASRDIRINEALPESPDNTSTADPLYRPDVVIYRDDGRVDLIIEIRHRHEIPPEKVDYYARRHFDWIEVVATDVQSTSDRLIARQHSFPMPCCVGEPVLIDTAAVPFPEAPLLAAQVPSGVHAVGRTPWGTGVAWNGRGWREL